MEQAPLATIARELLRVPPTAFTAERTLRSREVRPTDRALAGAIGHLRKPVPAAWVVDLLAAEDAIDPLAELVPVLRQAQAQADPATIRKLRSERESRLRAAVQRGAALAAEAGHPVGDAVLEQVEQTLTAATLDARAAAAARSGLLLRPLEANGLEPVDLDGALAVPDAVPDASASVAAITPLAGRRESRPKRGAPRPVGASGTAEERKGHRPRRAEPAHVAPDAAAEEREARSASRAADAAPVAADAAAEEREARNASRAADAALDTADAAVEAASARLDDLRGRKRALQQELEELDTQQADLSAEIAALEQERDAAESAADDARAAYVRARRQRRSAE